MALSKRNLATGVLFFSIFELDIFFFVRATSLMEERADIRGAIKAKNKHSSKFHENEILLKMSRNFTNFSRKSAIVGFNFDWIHERSRLKFIKRSSVVHHLGWWSRGWYHRSVQLWRLRRRGAAAYWRSWAKRTAESARRPEPRQRSLGRMQPRALAEWIEKLEVQANAQ